MRHLAITGIETASWISRIFETGDIRATPPSRRMSAGTRSSAMTAAAPAASAILAWSALTTSMMTPPFNISARPTFTRNDSSRPSCLLLSTGYSSDSSTRLLTPPAPRTPRRTSTALPAPPPPSSAIPRSMSRRSTRETESRTFGAVLARRIEVLPRRDRDSPRRRGLRDAAAGDALRQVQPEERIRALAAPPGHARQVRRQRLRRGRRPQRHFLGAARAAPCGPRRRAETRRRPPGAARASGSPRPS